MSPAQLLAAHREAESDGAVSPLQAVRDAIQWEDVSTDDLRALAEKARGQSQISYHDEWWTREMLLALFTNKYGRYVPEDL